jgi:hypothetical protein
LQTTVNEDGHGEGRSETANLMPPRELSFLLGGAFYSNSNNKRKETSTHELTKSFG